MTLSELNSASQEETRQVLLTCCGSTHWAEQMLARRPFTSPDTLHGESESIWYSLSAGDWLEAFSQHPQIGERSGSEWSREEQAGMSEAARDTAASIREMNAEYQQRFGYIFIVCATGKSAGEMHGLLEQRLANKPADELRNAAVEQMKITHLRLDKLLAA